MLTDAHRRANCRSMRHDSVLRVTQTVPFVFAIPDSTTGVSQQQNWIAISLTNASIRRIFLPTDCAAGVGRMRPDDKPVVGDMRNRMTRRCVSAATGNCR